MKQLFDLAKTPVNLATNVLDTSNKALSNVVGGPTNIIFNNIKECGNIVFKEIPETVLNEALHVSRYVGDTITLSNNKEK